MAGTENKLKILCIHGYRQTGQSFRERTGAFRKIPMIKKHTELVFITAPNTVPPLPGTSEGDPKDEPSEANQYSELISIRPTCKRRLMESPEMNQKGWWFSQGDRTYVAQDYTDSCPGYHESLQFVKQVFQEQGPFDGVLSFSQGAAFVSLLCGLQQQQLDPDVRFDFAVFVAGFKSRQSSHEQLYSSPISLPSLHVFGDTDKVIQKEMSEALLQYFVEPRTLQHEGGHFIPASAPQKKVYTEFLQDMLNKKTAKCQSAS